jgi:hypothetical protein
MDLQGLIEQFGVEISDTIEPFMVESYERILLLDEAVEEACKRKPLLFDDTTASICQITLVADTARYAISGYIDHIMAAYITSGTDDYIYLELTDRDALDNEDPLWRENTGDPKYLVVDEGYVTLSPPPEAAATLQLEVYRIPTEDETMEKSNDAPVIAEVHHRYLVYWACARALDRPDKDYYAPNDALRLYNEFEKYFGLRPDADRLRRTRENRPHRNKLWT